MAQQFDVTSVGVNPARDRAYRMRMYFLAMSLRVLCITSLFWLRGWWILLAALGAILLPYFAVLIANAVSHVGGTRPDAPAPLQLSAPATQAETSSDSQAEPLIIVVDTEYPRRGSAAGDVESSQVADSSDSPPSSSDSSERES